MTILPDKFSETFLGIEFKQNSLIMSRLKNDLSGMDLLSSSTFPLKDDDETLAEVKRFVAEGAEHPARVFVSIPRSWSIVKFASIPSPKGRGKTAFIHLMRFEIEKHIPFRMEDVSFDFQVVDRSGSICEVIIVAVQKEKIDYVKNFLEKLNLQPEIISLSPFAVVNAVELSEVSVGGWSHLLGITKKSTIWGSKDDICVLLSLDRESAHLAVLKGGSCVNMYSFTVDQNKETNEMANNISNHLAPLPEFIHKKINKIIILGSIPLLSELSGVLSARLGINVQAINPVAKFVHNREGAEIQELTPSIGVCYSGLGIGNLRINLLPHEPEVMRSKVGSLYAKIAVFLILFMIIGLFAGMIVNDRRLLTKIEKKLKDNEPEIQRIENVSSEIGVLGLRGNFLIDVRENNIVLDMLSELTKIVPEEAWLTNLDYKEIFDEEKKVVEGELIISGHAKSSSLLISILEDSPFFEKVEFVGSITKKGDQEGFKIRVTTVKPARSPKVPGSATKK